MTAIKIVLCWMAILLNSTFLYAFSALEEDPFDCALKKGGLAREGFERCLRYTRAWLEHADPETGLIPRNLNKSVDYWNAQDSAADNYPFMVLAAAFTDRPLFEGTMVEMLKTEKKLTSRLGPLPDDYSFSKNGFRTEKPDEDRILFGASEYIKDGLLPITEWLGKSPWSDRMIEMLDEMWARAPVETPHGKIVSLNQEVNGEMLQALSRIYWMTENEKYLDWAVRLGDFYLLGDHHPTRDEKSLRLRDHGCEIVSGLCELYATVHFARPEKKQAYSAPLHAMLDRILEVGRNGHGLFYNRIDPIAGGPADDDWSRGVSDTWGYTLNGFYAVFMVDGTEAYREAALEALGALNDHYRNFAWEGESSDGYADAIESALNLYNREPVPTAAEWIDSEIQVMWAKQKESGIIEGWHGDGNFTRTTLIYCLWKTEGLFARPWRNDLVLGAVREKDTLKISLSSEKEWKGKLLFDLPRHRTGMKLPVDWPRINQFPQWFTVEKESTYRVRDLDGQGEVMLSGLSMSQGMTVHLEAGSVRRLEVCKER